VTDVTQALLTCLEWVQPLISVERDSHYNAAWTMVPIPHNNEVAVYLFLCCNVEFIHLTVGLGLLRERL